jgi:NEDD8-activating enzyme E1 regulatory subunit
MVRGQYLRDLLILTISLVVESHSESTPSLRIDKPFPTLLDHAMSLDFAKMDSEEHAHIPYVVILVRALEDWKKAVR